MGFLLLKIGRWGHLVERNTRQLAAADAHTERPYEVHNTTVHGRDAQGRRRQLYVARRPA